MSLLDTASLIVTPNGYKAGTLFSVIPNTTLGDMDVVRATTATRVNSAGLIESVASNVPRLDYSNGTCPSILVEPQRTNIILQSENLATTWTSFRSIVTTNVTTSPSGINNADKVAQQSGNNDAGGVYQTISVTNGTSYTYSFFAKADGYNWCFARVSNSPSDFNAWFNLSTGVVGSTLGGVTSSSITSYGNGWYRCSMTFTSVATTALHHIYIANSNLSDQTPNADGVKGIYIYGVQLEAGSYATSYIPTTSASVTRNADVISKTGISSLIGQTEGTIFFDGILNNCEKSYANILNGERNNNASFSIIYVKSTNSLQAFILSNGFGVATIQAGYFLPGQRVKIAYSYKSGSSVLYLNGVQVGTSAQTFTLPSTIDDLYINDSVTYSGYQESVSNYTTALWKTKLTAVQLAQLTTI